MEDRMKRLAALILWLASVSALSAASVEEAYTLWLKGNYEEAFEHYGKIENADGAAVALGKSRCQRSQGEYAEALKLLTEATANAPKNADLLAATADLQYFLGRSEEAKESSEAAIAVEADNLPARWIRARLLVDANDNEKANSELEWFINYYNEKQPTEPEKLYLIAHAAAEFARRNQAPDEFEFILNTLLADAIKENENFWPAPYFAGILLLEKYNKAEGVPELRNALRINPSSAEVLCGLASASLQDYDFVEGTNFADQALSVDSNFPEARRLKAELLIVDERVDPAIEQLKRALEINPHSEETLARLAVCYYLKNQPDKAEAIEKEVVARNPKPGVFYAILGDILERRRQFGLAEKYLQLAITAAPHLADPMNGLGMLCMRLGKEDEARKILARAREIDPFHVRVSNMVKVLKHLEEYKPVVTDHYEVWVRNDKDELLGKAMAEYLEATHDKLCRRFGYEPKGRTKIEIMIDHKWFSARVIGLPSVGTVGACTGNVVALTSPGSLRSPYNWARVLTHEVVHIINLAQTNYNIPHWFTEALAVHAEGYPRPEVWNQLLAERVPKNDLLNLDTINHAFIRPKTPLDWQFAYCQSLLYAEYIIENWGESAIAKLLDIYKDGTETSVAIPKAIGISKEEFEKGYKEYLVKLVAGLKTTEQPKAMSFSEAENAYRAKPDDPKLAAELALHYYQRKNMTQARELAEKSLAKEKNHPLALYILARMEMSIGKTDEAMKILEPAFDPDKPDPRVIDLLASMRIRRKEYPEAIRLYEIAHKGDPLSSKWVKGLAKVYLLTNDEEKLDATLKIVARMDADDVTVRKKLAELAAKRLDWGDAEKWARETTYIEVSDPAAHRILGDAAREHGNFPAAVDHYQTAFKLEPKNADVPVKLAEVLIQAGDPDKARVILERLQKQDPDSAAVKKLIEKLGAP